MILVDILESPKSFLYLNVYAIASCFIRCFINCYTEPDILWLAFPGSWTVYRPLPVQNENCSQVDLTWTWYLGCTFYFLLLKIRTSCGELELQIWVGQFTSPLQIFFSWRSCTLDLGRTALRGHVQLQTCSALYYKFEIYLKLFLNVLFNIYTNIIQPRSPCFCITISTASAVYGWWIIMQVFCTSCRSYCRLNSNIAMC